MPDDEVIWHGLGFRTDFHEVERNTNSKLVYHNNVNVTRVAPYSRGSDKMSLFDLNLEH